MNSGPPYYGLNPDLVRQEEHLTKLSTLNLGGVCPCGKGSRCNIQYFRNGTAKCSNGPLSRALAKTGLYGKADEIESALKKAKNATDIPQILDGLKARVADKAKSEAKKLAEATAKKAVQAAKAAFPKIQRMVEENSRNQLREFLRRIPPDQREVQLASMAEMAKKKKYPKWVLDEIENIRKKK